MSHPNIVRALAFLAAIAAATAFVPAEAQTPRAGTIRFNLADIPADGLSGGWGEPQRQAAKPERDPKLPAPKELGELRYRVAQKGGRRMFQVKAWWSAERLRPPEGAVYVLEVQYKDTVTSPAVFYVHSGLGRYWGPSPIHRFGGAGDGKWRTANVPVSWDYLIRLPDDRDKTAFGVQADADLPIGTVRVRPAAAADEARYNAETRAWIATVQSEKAAKTPLKVEPRKFLRGREVSAMAAFSWPALVPLLPDLQPKPDQIGRPVKVRMCLNELEGGSFGVYANGVDVTGVDYKVSELAGPGGTLKAEIIRRTAEYCLVQKRRGLMWFPQRLWPAHKVDIAKGRCHWFLFNVRTKRGVTKPGRYRGTITITSERASTMLPLEVEVLPVDLLTMDEAGLLMGGCVTGLVPAHDIAFQADYNQNATNLWWSISPPMTAKSGKLELDFAYLDEWMGSARKRGLKAVVWFLGGDPYGWPDTVNSLRDLARMDVPRERDAQARQEWVRKQADEANRNSILPEIRPLFKEWVRQVDTHARAAGWPEIIFTPFDEPAKWVQEPYRKTSNYPGVIGTGPWIKPFFKDCCAAIREAAPKARIYGSIHHNRTPENEGICFLPDIDVFCTNAIHEDAKLGDKVRAAGKDFWQYTGVGNSLTPDQARYAFGFFFAAFDSRGSLCWAYNWGAGFDTTEGSNWMYAWQTPFDTIPAPYFEGMREAWDDRRIIETYKKEFVGDAAAMAVLEGILKSAVGSRARGGRDTVSDFWSAVDDVAKLDKWRKQLLDRLAKAK